MIKKSTLKEVVEQQQLKVDSGYKRSILSDLNLQLPNYAKLFRDKTAEQLYTE